MSLLVKGNWCLLEFNNEYLCKLMRKRNSFHSYSNPAVHACIATCKKEIGSAKDWSGYW